MVGVVKEERKSRKTEADRQNGVTNAHGPISGSLLIYIFFPFL
jgi:hypothetical protein